MLLKEALMRLAHITDTHIRVNIPGHASIPKRRSRESFGLLEQAIYDARSRGAEAIVVTGDLLDVPTYLLRADPDAHGPDELWPHVRRDYELIRTTLEQCGLPWIVVPGNHDCLALMAEVFGGAPRVRDIGPLRFISFWDREHAGHVPRRVLHERARFDAALMDPSPAPQVHLQHFVVTPALNDGYPHTYLEGAELERRTVASGRVALSLSGHYHPGVEPVVIGGTTFGVTPALTESPHPYRLFDVETAGAGTTTVTSECIALDPRPVLRPAVFLDRDGCINTLPSYQVGPGSMELIPNAAAGLRLLKAAGFTPVVITNQSCVGLGYVTPETVEQVNDRMGALLHAEGAEVAAIYASYDAGDDAVHPIWNIPGEAKPSPRMIERAARELNLDLSRSYLVGDRRGDLEAAWAAGVQPILVRTGAGSAEASALRINAPVVADLAEAASLISANRSRDPRQLSAQG